MVKVTDNNVEAQMTCLEDTVATIRVDLDLRVAEMCDLEEAVKENDERVAAIR